MKKPPFIIIFLVVFIGLSSLTLAQGTYYTAPTSYLDITQYGFGGSPSYANYPHYTSLWIPNNVAVIRGVIIINGTTGANTDTSWQALARAHDFAVMGTQNYVCYRTTNILAAEVPMLLADLSWYATASGHPEVVNLPFVLCGWSTGGQVAYGINSYIPNRVIAYEVNKGGNYFTGTLSTAALQTPGIYVAGQTDTTTRITAITGLFKQNRPMGGLCSLAFEQNMSHAEGNVNGVWFTFFDHAIRARYPTNTTPLSNTVTLLNLSETNGWLAAQPTTDNGLSGSVYTYTNYPGASPTNASWLMDADVANLYRGLATYNTNAQPAVTVTPVGGPLYSAPETIQFQVSVNSTAFPGWVTADVYDGASKLGTVTNGGPTSTVYAVRPWGGRGVMAIAYDASGNQRISIPKAFVVNKNVASAWNNGSRDFLWNTSSSNWGGVAWTQGADAVFGSNGVGTITLSGTQTLADSLTALCFDFPGYKLTGGTLSLPTNSGGNSGFNLNADAEIASVITGPGSLTKNGNGVLTLSGNNTYYGTTVVNAGTLKLSNGGNLGNSFVPVSGTLAIAQSANGSTNALNGYLTLYAGANFTMADTYISTFNVGGAALSAISGAPPVLTFDIASTNLTSDKLAIGGSVSIATNALPTIVPNFLAVPSSGSNTYTLITAASGLGLGATNFNLAPENITIGGNPYHTSLASSTDTAVILSFVPGTIIIPYYWKGGIDGKWTSENFKLDAAGTSATTELPNSATSVYMTANTANNFTTTLDQAFIISGLTFTGSGTANTNGSIIGAGSGGTLQINSGGISVNAGSGSIAITAPVTLGSVQSWTNNSVNALTVGPVNNGGFLLTIAGSGNTTINGALSGTGSLTQSASGVLTLSGNNTYTGTTTINTGTLAIAHSNALAGGGKVNVVGGTLDLGTHNITNSLSLQAGAVQNGYVTLNSSNNYDIQSGTTLWNVQLNGSAGLIKTTSGTATLAGANFFTGPTTIYAGTLTIGWYASLYSSIIVNIVGGTLDLNGVGVSNGYPAIFPISLQGGTLQNGMVTYNGGNFDIQSGMEASNAILADRSGSGGLAAGLTKSTAGTAILAGSNTYTGLTTITEGTLELDGSIAGSLSVQAGGTLTGNGTITRNLIVASNGIARLSGGTFTVNGNITNNGTIILNNGAQITGYSSFNGNVVVTNSGLSNQTITFPSIPAQTIGSGPVTLGATASSGLPVSYNSSSTNISLSSNVVTILGAGTATIIATQNGNASWNAATPVSNQLVVNTNSLASIIPVGNGSFETPGDSVGGSWAMFGNPWNIIDQAPSVFQQVQAVSGEFFTNAPNGTWVALINNDSTPITNPITQNLGANVTNGDTLSITFSFGRQKDTYPGGQGVAYFDVGGTKYTMPFDASVLSPGSWQSTTMTKTITNSGPLSLGFYSTSGHDTNAWVDNISNITRTPGLSQQTITFPSIPAQIYGSGPVTLGATASSGLPVSYNSSSTNISLSSNVVTILGAGTAMIVASQAGNSNYMAATSVTNQLVISQATQTISPFAIIPTQTYATNMTMIIKPPTANSSQPVSVKVLSGPATMSGNTLTLTGTGTVVLAADQSGNENYLAAPQITTNFTVAPAATPVNVNVFFMDGSTVIRKRH